MIENQNNTQEPKVSVELNKENSVENALEYCGIESNDPHKQIAHYHASKLLRLIIKCDGKPSKEILSKARLYVGISERYINEYYCSFLSWGIIAINGNSVKYIGIPEEDKPQPESLPAKNLQKGYPTMLSPKYLKTILKTHWRVNNEF
jgi:hypothetical protein